MVKGWSSKSKWGFPKGKIAKGETPEACAIREVKEEIGYDIAPYIDPNSFIEIKNNFSDVRLYIIYGIKEEAKFAPISRKEIREITWHGIEDIKRNINQPIYSTSRLFLKKFLSILYNFTADAMAFSAFQFLDSLKKELHEFIESYPNPFTS